MAVSQTNAYKNKKRDYQRALTREALFVSSYIQSKHKSLYEEAARLYNEINKKYPQKPDLRRTIEFREWKNNVAVENNAPTIPVPRQKKYRYRRKIHRNIPIEIATAEMSNETPAESPRNQPSIEKQTADQQTDNRLAGMTMRLSIPLMQIPATPKPAEHPEGILTAASNEIVMEEGEQTDVFDPSTLDGISAETMDKIISELQADPHLKELMDDVQTSFEEEEEETNVEERLLDLIIDLPELDNQLEEELMLW